LIEWEVYAWIILQKGETQNCFLCTTIADWYFAPNFNDGQLPISCEYLLNFPFDFFPTTPSFLYQTQFSHAILIFSPSIEQFWSPPLWSVSLTSWRSSIPTLSFFKWQNLNLRSWFIPYCLLMPWSGLRVLHSFLLSSSNCFSLLESVELSAWIALMFW
jgi:hypothetical protein